MVVHRGSKLAGKYEQEKSYELIIDGNENRIETNKFSLEVRANIES